MAIKLRLKSRVPQKALPPKSVEEIALETFNDWVDAANRGNSNLGGLAGRTYFAAVQSGFKEHQTKWIDCILEAGGMSMKDFPDAPGQEKRRWKA